MINVASFKCCKVWESTKHLEKDCCPTCRKMVEPAKINGKYIVKVRTITRYYEVK